MQELDLSLAYFFMCPFPLFLSRWQDTESAVPVCIFITCYILSMSVSRIRLPQSDRFLAAGSSVPNVQPQLLPLAANSCS